MSRVIVHVGTHKTGTTAIQTFFAGNAMALDKLGMCYPETRVKWPYAARARNAHFLFQYARSAYEGVPLGDELASVFAANVDGVAADLRNFDTLIVSDEWLWYYCAAHPGSWQHVKSLLTNMGVEIVDVVVYLRRQDEFIASLWNQHVKSIVRLTETLEDYASSERSRLIMDYYSGVCALSSVFGKDHVHVGVYERPRLMEGDVRRDFCALMGIDAQAGFVFERIGANPSLSSTVVEIKRQANHIARYAATDNFLQEPAVEASLLSGRENPASQLLPEHLRRSILNPYLEGNSRIARDFLGIDSGKLFSQIESRLSSVPAISDSASVRDAIRLFTAVMTEEHIRLEEARKRIAELEKRLDVLEQRDD